MVPQKDRQGERDSLLGLELLMEEDYVEDSVLGSKTAMMIPEDEDEAQKIAPMAPGKKHWLNVAPQN